MSKGDRIEAYVASLGLAGREYDPCYLAYFGCFNDQEYYEAHDVLEHLWLQGAKENYGFFKGLIQLAGAFVHLKKQYLRPWHPKDANRMRPAVRLFLLAEANLVAYGTEHMGLDLNAVRRLIEDHVNRIRAARYQVNSWDPGAAPQLKLH
jgi:hypothetical protein